MAKEKEQSIQNNNLAIPFVHRFRGLFLPFYLHELIQRDTSDLNPKMEVISCS